jgi:hypothetical protein
MASSDITASAVERSAGSPDPSVADERLPFFEGPLAVKGLFKFEEACVDKTHQGKSFAPLTQLRHERYLSAERPRLRHVTSDHEEAMEPDSAALAATGGVAGANATDFR